MSERDWAENPPKNMDEARIFARQLAKETCDELYLKTGEQPHYEEKENSIFIVWPDGEITNEIEICHAH